MTMHLCHAGCGRRCPPAKLMCAPCWKLVPKPEQLAVYAHYTPGQERRYARPTERWHAAARAAIQSARSHPRFQTKGGKPRETSQQTV